MSKTDEKKKPKKPKKAQVVKEVPMPVDNEARRVALLGTLGLDPNAPALGPTVPQVEGVQFAPQGMDPHTMPVTSIVFDPRMVEQFVDLRPTNRRAAADHVFALYKSYGRDKDRNSLLYRRIGEFLAAEHRRRTTGDDPFVKGKIRLAHKLSEAGVSEGDLEEFMAWKAAQG